MKKYIPTREDRSQIKGKFHPRRQKSKKEEAEFGPGKIDYLICPKCYCVYFDKSWHHSLDEDIKRLKDTKRIQFQVCPACQMIKGKKYEGEIILENIPGELKEDIKILAKNFGERAFGKDPMDRIISIEERRVGRVGARRKRGASSRKEFKGLRDVRILATENQLAVRLAKKINEVYGGKLSREISHSHTEDTVRVKIQFP